jgi:hypothetical protein
MAEQHGAQVGKARVGKAQAGTWPGTTGIAAPWLRPLPDVAGPLAARLRTWAAAEVAPGRLMPCLPSAFHGVPSNYKKPLCCGHNLSS